MIVPNVIKIITKRELSENTTRNIIHKKYDSFSCVIGSKYPPYDIKFIHNMDNRIKTYYMYSSSYEFLESLIQEDSQFVKNSNSSIIEKNFNFRLLKILLEETFYEGKESIDKTLHLKTPYQVIEELEYLYENPDLDLIWYFAEALMMKDNKLLESDMFYSWSKYEDMAKELLSRREDPSRTIRIFYERIEVDNPNIDSLVFNVDDHNKNSFAKQIVALANHYCVRDGEDSSRLMRIMNKIYRNGLNLYNTEILLKYDTLVQSYDLNNTKGLNISVDIPRKIILTFNDKENLQNFRMMNNTIHVIDNDYHIRVLSYESRESQRPVVNEIKKNQKKKLVKKPDRNGWIGV